MRTLLSLFALLLSLPLHAQWYQWGRTGVHDSRSPVIGQRLEQLQAQVVLDPHVEAEKALANGNLLVHYQAPVVDGNDVYLVVKSGEFTGFGSRETQIWNVRNMRWSGGSLETRWNFISDWKPMPLGGGAGGPSWEPVYHVAITADEVWAPAFGGRIARIRRSDGALLEHLNPFGPQINPSIFTAGPPSVDANGNVFYTAMQLDLGGPWNRHIVDSWLVRVGADGVVTKATIVSLTPNAPGRDATCSTAFTDSLPWPPTANAVAPIITCGAQRPGINIAPAIAPDGTVYIVSRAHLNDRWAYLIAANNDLSPKWSTSLRNRLNDGCNVTIPPNGTPGGCRQGSTTGVDPAENQPGSGRVRDDGTSSPVVLPDGKILYGAYTRYNYSQGHLMQFEADGTFLRAYPFGWDITPGVYEHDGTYSIRLKENRYSAGSYCNDSRFCPFDRTVATPQDPEAYYITSLDPNLNVEWKYRNAVTESCRRNDDGTVTCVNDHPNGFEWCINAVAVDALGITYVNGEDGRLYALNPNGTVRQSIFLRLALGAAYTPLSIGPDGRIYTQNDGQLFVVGQTEMPPRRRATGR